MKILLIEDEPLILKSLQRLLVRANCEVDTESSGKMAIEKIIKGNYDRIICDLMLKDITGFDVIEESKRKYSAIDISNIFVIITAYSSEQVITKAAEYGCAVLSKPFSDINAALRLFLNKQDQL